MGLHLLATDGGAVEGVAGVVRASCRKGLQFAGGVGRVSLGLGDDLLQGLQLQAMGERRCWLIGVPAFDNKRALVHYKNRSTCCMMMKISVHFCESDDALQLLAVVDHPRLQDLGGSA